MTQLDTSIVLIAVGAILKWAVTAHVNGINIQTAGTVLFVVGIVGLVLSRDLHVLLVARRARDETRPGRPAQPHD